MSQNGKGSKPRPFSVTNEEYAQRWDAIFGRDVKTKEEEELDFLQEIEHNKTTGLLTEVKSEKD